MCAARFFTTFVWNITHSKSNWARSEIRPKYTLVFVQTTRYSCPILMKLEFSRQIWEKYSNTKFHENPFSGSRTVPCGRTDKHDVANSGFSQFCDTPTNVTYLCSQFPCTSTSKATDNWRLITEVPVCQTDGTSDLTNMCIAYVYFAVH
jgi:hypothetical protein